MIGPKSGGEFLSDVHRGLKTLGGSIKATGTGTKNLGKSLYKNKGAVGRGIIGGALGGMAASKYNDYSEEGDPNTRNRNKGIGVLTGALAGATVGKYAPKAVGSTLKFNSKIKNEGGVIKYTRNRFDNIKNKFKSYTN